MVYRLSKNRVAALCKSDPDLTAGWREAGVIGLADKRNRTNKLLGATGGMTINLLLLTFFLLQVKHLFADYIWQSGWMVSNKGNYGHLGGIAHAGLHALLTLLVLLVLGFNPLWVLIVSLGELVLHYHIDWTKDQIIRRRQPSPKTREYWVYTGLDQFGHQSTLLLVVAVLVWFG